MERPSSIKVSNWDGTHRYCEDCTMARLGEAMTIKCNRPVDGGYCRKAMGHDGDHEPRHVGSPR
jgi:hypothetical protein